VNEKKGWGQTVLGWFVVREGVEGDPQVPAVDSSADELIAKYASEAPPAPSPVQLQGEVKLPVQPSEPIDFPGVYRAAGIDDDEQGRIAKAQSLLKTLPAETPREVKRTIVEASLKAFGYPVEQIIEAGAQEIQALQAYIEIGQRDTQKLLSQGNERIAALEKEMAEVRRLMEEKVAAQMQLTQQCNAEKLRVQEVLEFFGQEAVAKVVQESPKLHEPGRQ
jgi:hypothetical protein